MTWVPCNVCHQPYCLCTKPQPVATGWSGYLTPIPPFNEQALVDKIRAIVDDRMAILQRLLEAIRDDQLSAKEE